MDIDAVILWVDGDDPDFAASMAGYMTDKSMAKVENIAGKERYSNFGEICWSVASINRFAPWVRKIWVVTNGQDPHLDDFLKTNFPDGYIPYEIVDHKVIFRGYESYLPTFSSTAIETMTWRIPGLAEHYLDMNDDFLIARPVLPSDFFDDDGRPVCYCRKESLPWQRLKLKKQRKEHGLKPVTSKGKMINSADMIGEKHTLLRIQHTPRAILKSFFSEYYAAHPGVMERNIKDRFRSADNYNIHELFYLSLWREGKCILKPYMGNLLYMKPKPRNGKNYVASKVARIENGKCKFICVNSLTREYAEELRPFIERWYSITLIPSAGRA